MEFKIGEDTEEITRREEPRRDAPNYSSLGTRLRLMSLVAMLVLVLMAMEKASKPETWERLGFREPVVEPARGGAAVGGNTNGDGAVLVLDNQVSDQSGEKIAAPDDNLVPELDKGSADVNVQSLGNSGETDFWVQFYEMLSDKKKRHLLRMLRFARIEQPLLEQYFKTSTEIITQLGPALKTHLSELEAAELEAAEFESQKELLGQQRQALAAIAIGQTPEPAQREMILAIESRLREKAFADVRDRTPMKRGADGPAWIFAWEQVLAGDDAALAVSYLQLMSQPEFYRGKRVELKGTIQGAQRVATKGNELGIESYFVVWMQPEEAGTGPFCIYVFELPDDFPVVGDQFTQIQVPAKISGLFFKLRVYAARSGEVPTCPLVLARTLEREKEEAVAVSSDWQADPKVLFPFFLIALPLVSYLAYVVYQSSKTKLPNHGKVARARIEKTFEELKQDPGIKSDIERIRDLDENGN